MIVFLFGLISGIKFLINDIDTEEGRKKIATGIFIIAISLMQLNEFFLWKNLKNNRFWSWMILVTLVIQISALYFSEYFLKLLNPSSGLPIDISITFFYAIFLLSFIILIFTLPRNINTTRGSGCRLEWGPFRKYGYLSTFFATIYLILVIMLSYKLFGDKAFIIFGITFGLAILYGLYSHTGLNAIWGSLWCFLVIIVGILASIFDFLP